MKNYIIKNQAEISEFMSAAQTNGHVLFAVKGAPPVGAEYSDGDLIVNPVNVAWLNKTTCESIEIQYSKRQEGEV